MELNELFKNRSVTACMKASYELVGNHLPDMVKKTWWAFLPYALLTTVMIYFRLPNKPLHDWGEDSPVGSFVIQTIVYLSVFVLNFVAGSAIWTWLNGKPFGRNLLRFTGMYLLLEIVALGFCMAGSALYTAVFLALSGGKAPTSPAIAAASAAGLVLVVVITLFVALLPFAYVLPRYMLLAKGEKLRLWQSYKRGLRHLGSIFKMGFLGSLVLLVATAILFVPGYILMGAQVFSQLGALDGDPLGVPAYFTPMLIVVLTALLFIANYLGAWLAISFAYLYGTCRTQDEEREAQARALIQGQDNKDNIR